MKMTIKQRREKIASFEPCFLSEYLYTNYELYEVDGVEVDEDDFDPDTNTGDKVIDLKGATNDKHKS